MARTNPVFVCNACGGETLKWQGQCPLCGEWNCLEQRAVPVRAARGGTSAGAGGLETGVARRLESAVAGVEQRLASGQEELDRVMGGGIVPGSVTLLGGDPGIGKSTLLLQVAAHVARSNAVLYASGEESVSQVGLRARRLGIEGTNLEIVAESSLDNILTLASAAEAPARRALLVVDSIQTVQSNTVPSSPGAVSQLRECTAELVRYAKSTATAVIIIGHVTKEGTIAGPRMLEHLVDTVLYFESEAGSRFRIVRSIKNRFGAVNELGFFAMAENGLREVRNPSAIFLSRAAEPAAGSIVTVTREGGRPLLIELQALVDRMRFGAPRRIAQGLDSNRVAMLLAVMNRHARVSLQEHDVFVNVVGGIQISDTGWDLPVVLALASSLTDKTVPNTLVSFGEIGLTGEVRPVAYGEERLREAHKQGFRVAVVPKDNAPRKPLEGLQVIPVTRVEEALTAAFSQSP